MLFWRAGCGCNIIAKNPVDGFGRHTYMAPHSGGRGLLRKVGVRFVPLLGRYNRCPERIEPGEEARRLFDIVGLDEGTCGRRPGHR
jgi:hypothetical protein